MSHKVIDSHSHIDYGYFFEKILTTDSLLTAIIAGASQHNWHQLEKLSSHKNLFPCFGIHPWYVGSHIPYDLTTLDNLISQYNPVAVGECGLDYYLPKYSKKLQQFYLYKQLDLAVKHQLPVILHACKSYDQLHKIIKSYPNLTGVVHGFNGSLQQAIKWIDLGFYLGFGKNVLFKNSSKISNVLVNVPIDKILIESDAPDSLTISTSTSYFELLNLISQQLADTKNISVDEIVIQCNQNARCLFALPV